MNNTITFEQIKEHIPDKTYLLYVDYRENLDDHTDVMSECLRKGEWYPLDEMVWDWYMEAPYYALEHYLPELRTSLETEFEDIQLVDSIMDEYEDEIRDEYFDRDHSTPLDDLLSNTSDQVMFYDTGVEFPDLCFIDDEEFDDYLNEIKEVLDIDHNEYDERIGMMMRQASYGGNLVVFFLNGDLGSFLKDDIKALGFTDPVIAIIDRWNGSGDNTDLGGHSFTLSFNRDNLHFDKSTNGYSYTYDVCGMYSDWCSQTVMNTLFEDVETETKSSSLNVEIERDKKYQETYDKGGCTFGDIKYSRHRNTKYINDFPCGTKCTDCGTFWID